MRFLLPHFLHDGPGPARHLLHARLQPDVDQPRRLHLAARCCATRPSSGARRADAHVVGDGVVRRLRAADGRRPRAPRHRLLRDPRRALARLPPAGAAAAMPSATASRWSAPTRRTPARSGRRTSSGSTSRGASTRTASLGIRQYFESDERPGEPIGIDEYYGRLFDDSRPGPPRGGGRGRGPHPARVHAPLRRVRDPGRHVRRARAAGRRDRAVEGCDGDDRACTAVPGPQAWHAQLADIDGAHAAHRRRLARRR